MTTLLSGTNIKKQFLGEPLFEEVSFSVFDADKIGFVGVNGVGKSTLFKLITGETDYDGGAIFKSKETRIGYLEQHPVFDESATVIDYVMTAFDEVMHIEKTLESIRSELEKNNGDTDGLIARQTALQERFLELDGMCYRSKVKSALTGLGFSENDFSTPVCKLSGGQKTRVALCRLLLSDANLLLLDEPTNHLDIQSVEWLEDFLLNYDGAFIVISHDRFFLDRVTDKTFELENKRFRSYDGNYTAYMAQKELERLSRQRDYDFAVGEIARLKEVIEQQRRWKHKKNKKTHTLDNTRKAIERIEKNLVKPDKAPDSMRFRFKACAGGAQRVIETEKLGMGFNGTMLFENVDMLIKKGEKVFILGPNGCGKTTLIKIITGIYTQIGGKCRIGDNIRVGYYDQLKENLHRDKTIIDEVWDEHHTLTQTEIRSALALFLFKGADVFKEIRTLSGGELARVELTKLLLSDVNLLIMDEPTNHLDIVSREALEVALTDYDGTILMVSHDRYFINRLADRILYLTPNGIISYTGNYEDFLESRQQEEENKPTARVVVKNNSYEEKKRREAEKRKIINRHAKVEALIAETENKIAELTEEYNNPANGSDYLKLCEISDQTELLNRELDKLMTEWEELQRTIDEM